MVDNDFLKMFDIEFVHGDINNALNEPHNIVITEEMASNTSEMRILSAKQ